MLTSLALFEPVAVAVHLEDMDMVGQPVEESAGQALGGEHAGPLVEGQIAGDDGGAALVALGEHLEQQFGAGLGELLIPEQAAPLFRNDGAPLFRSIAAQRSDQSSPTIPG